jgi:peroxisomal 2,4-dienoyl-CoA reductase
MPLQAHVSAAKASIDSLMASVALEYGPRGVTSNVIAPGGIDGTEGLARLGSDAESEKKRYAKGIPLGRAGTVRDIADATVFLFGEAGSYVDGAAWRRQGAISVGTEAGMEYPDYILNGEFSKNLRDPRKNGKAKL